MPILTNPRHEKFAQLLAQGRTEYGAYELCHYKPHRGNPCKLARKVAARVEEITQEAARRTIINKEYLIEKSEELRARGMEIDQLAAAGTAIRELGVLTGHRVERAEIGGPGEFDHLSDDELLAAIRERFARLDSETQLAISDWSITLNGTSRNPKDRDR
jgi:hypothetical protein